MMRWVWLGAALLAAPLQAGEVVTSPAPGKVAVTIYRAPQRPADEPMALGWLGGYALITETREVSIPAGEAEIRFEGVAAGMLPESAIVTGLPGDVAEKNLDADLLSPRNLYARAFGRPVVLRRTDAGGTHEEAAIIRSGPDGAAVLQTKAGFEIANCGGLSDALAYQGLPAGLNARPTLSVATQSPRAVRALVQLSYLAWGFDWQAHYVLAMRPGAREADLTAWVTLASSDATSFSQAKAAVVGGKPHFDEVREGWPESGEMELTCQITHMPPPPAMKPAPPPPVIATLAAPAVMAMRAFSVEKALAPVVVSQEALGDLKLYRVPMPTTVAAHAQKQVALLDARRVKLALIHGADITPGGSAQAQIKLRLHNRKADGLGLALPAGKLTVVQPLGDAAIPVGEGRLDDKAEGEEATIAIAASTQVRIKTIATPWQDGVRRTIATVTNANRWPVHFEGRLRIVQGASVERSSTPLSRRDGLPLWSVTVPAHGKAVLTYTEREPNPPRR